MAKILGFVLLFLSSQAHAGLLFEPYAGYSLGTVAITTSATYPVAAMQNYSDSGSISGFGYGGRVGFLLHHFVILAAEYQAVSAKEKYNTSVTSLNWTQNTTFATLGFQAPRGFRFMGSYGFAFNATENTTPSITTYKGTAFKLAVGWLLMPEVAINVEYSIYKLTDYTQAGTTYKVSDTFTKSDYSAVMVNLSFPLTFHPFGNGGGGGKSPR